MRFGSALSTLALIGALAMPAAAQTAPTITVTGEGQVAVTPDMATVSLGVTVNAETAKAALDANSAALSAVIDRLKSAGIEARDIQTTGLSVGPIFDFSSSAAVQKVLGYTASNMVTVQVRAIDQVGPVLDASVTDGANTLNGVMFGLQDQRAATDEARTAAVAEARRRAELLAGAAGVKLGRVLAISDQGGFASPMPMGGMAMDRAASVPVAAGSMTVSASVTVTYELAE